LDPPRDGDRSSGEDGMIAEVIPLRRRTPDAGRHEGEPTHSGMFDPPPDPEPPEEYSVWERPTAELLRRERPDDLAPSNRGRRGWGAAVLSRRAHAAAILATLVASVALIIGTAGSHRTRRNPASAGLGGVQAGLGAPLGSAQPSAKPPGARRSAARSRRKSTHRSTEGMRPAAPRPTSEPTVASAPATVASAPATVASTPATVASTPAQAPTSGPHVSTPTVASQPAGQSHREASTATAASREFGFEH
jgi:hypothetical protein